MVMVASRRGELGMGVGQHRLILEKGMYLP